MSRWYVLYLFQEFRRALVQMFAENDDQDCVFMECSKNLRKHPHMLIECIPLERELGDMAPIYFKVSVYSESRNEKLHNLSLEAASCILSHIHYCCN